MKGSNINKLGKIEKNKKVKPGDCIFPFKYQWITYNNKCAPTEKGDICATSVNDKQTLQTYGYCDEKKETPKSTITPNSSFTSDETNSLVENMNILELPSSPLKSNKKQSPQLKKSKSSSTIEEDVIDPCTNKPKEKQSIIIDLPKSPTPTPRLKSISNIVKNIDLKENQESSTSPSMKRYNEDFIQILEELAEILGRQGEHFKSRAYKNASETIMTFDENITNLDVLKNKPAIGKTILEKLKEYMTTGTLRILERERNNPLNIFTRVYGIGPKKAKQLIDDGLTTIEQLRENKDKLNNNQQLGLKYYEDIQQRIPRSEIKLFDEELNKVFDLIKNKVPGSKFEIVGSYRRGAENSGDIDIIITNENNDANIFNMFLDTLKEKGILIEFLSRGKTKSLTIGEIPDHIPRRLDFLYSSIEEYPFAVLYFTGSKAFNTNMRQRALQKGYSLNEHGFSKMDGKKKGEKIDQLFKNEQEIFDFLDMEYKEPNERKDGRSVVLKNGVLKLDESVKMSKTTKPKKKSEKVITDKTEVIGILESLPQNKTGIVDEISKKQPKKLKLVEPKEKKEKKIKNSTLKKKFDYKKEIEKIKNKGINAIKLLNEEELSIILKKSSDAYYNKKPLMSDNVFDIIKEYIETNHPESKVLDEIGAPVKRDKVTLPYFMASMDKIKPDTNALQDFKKKYKGPYVLTGKLDGVSALYTTEHETPKLYTRGNGSIGQDISHLIPYLDLPTMKNITARGELIMKKEIFDEKYKDDFSNGRNMVSGIVNQKKIEKSKFRDVDFVAYEVIHPSMKPSKQIETLEKANFNVVIHMEEDEISNDLLSALLVNWRSSYLYEIDGIIVTNDSIEERKSENPDHAFAFKMVLSDQIAETKVLDVLWTPSKDGYLKPRIQIEPVRLGGAKIEYATAFNGQFVKDNNLGIGSVIEIIRSGDVIPHIRKVHQDQNIQAKMPDVPYVWNDTHVDIMLENPNDDEKVNETIIKLFFKGLDVEGLGEGNVKKLIEAGFDSIDKIVKMSEEDFLQVKNFEKVMANKVYSSIQDKIQKASLVKLMAASNVFGRGFGERKIGPILKSHPSILTSSEDDTLKIKKILMVKGMAEKSAKKFVQNIPVFIEFLSAIHQSSKLDKKETPQKGNVDHELFEKKIVFTGFRDKPTIEILKDIGSSIENSIGKSTYAVIVKDETSKTTGKAQKASEKGITIYTLDEFKNKYGL